jgi:protein-tyrosine phosphatase
MAAYDKVCGSYVGGKCSLRVCPGSLRGLLAPQGIVRSYQRCEGSAIALDCRVGEIAAIQAEVLVSVLDRSGASPRLRRQPPNIFVRIWNDSNCIDGAPASLLFSAATKFLRGTYAVSEHPFVDIHCHLLPGIDDGAKDWRDTLAMARLAADDGFSTIVTTPHQLGNWSQNTGEDIRHLTAQVQNVLREQKIPITLLAGGDVRIEPDLIAKIRSGEVMTLADRGRHVLLELPHELYVPLDRLLEELRAAGLVGILSHPERNQGILARPEVLEPLVRGGCLMQVTAGSLAGSFGPGIGKFAAWMVSEGLVHFLATDAHSPRSRRPIMSRAFDQATRLVGERLAVEMCSTNPAQVAAGEDVKPGIRPGRSARRGLGSWFGWRKAG